MSRISGSIVVAAVGKLRTNHWKLAQVEYQNRLEHYVDFKLIEVKDVVGQGLPEKNALDKEGRTLLQRTKTAHRLIALTPTGMQMTSPELANHLKRQVQLYHTVAFLIGGPIGFSDDLLVNCHEQLSLSPLTYPHELARVVLLEQLYRAFTIINKEKYHK